MAIDIILLAHEHIFDKNFIWALKRKIKARTP